MSYLLTDLLGQQLGLGSARSLLALAKNSNIENILSIAIRVVVVGALIAGLRRAASWFSVWLDRCTYLSLPSSCCMSDLSDLYPSAYIAVTDTSYLWIMAWLAQDPAAQAQIKDFQLSTSEWRQVRQGSGNALRGGHGAATGSPTAVGEHNSSWSAKDIIGQVLPAYRRSVLAERESHKLITRPRDPDQAWQKLHLGHEEGGVLCPLQLAQRGPYPDPVRSHHVYLSILR